MNSSTMSNNDNRRKKRLSASSSTGRQKKGRVAASAAHDDMVIDDTTSTYLPTSIRPTVQPDTDPAVMKLELQRLLYAMESSSTTGSENVVVTTPTDWVRRSDLLQALWQNVRQHSSPTDVTAMDKRILAACQHATMQQQQQQQTVAKPAAAAADVVVRQVFAAPVTVQRAAHDDNNDDDKDDHTTTTTGTPVPPAATPAAPRASTTTTTAVVPSSSLVHDLQEVQRAQVEQVISEMAAQLKEETGRLHSTLQGQTQNLSHLESVAADNVEALTAVTADVEQHVSQSWSRTIGTWTMFLTVLGAFVFGLVTIQMVPKRTGACLFFCPKVKDEFCRILPSGRKECIAVPKEPVAADQQEPEAVVVDNDDDDTQFEYEMNMYGEQEKVVDDDDADQDHGDDDDNQDTGETILPHIQIPSDEEMREQVLHEVEETRRQESPVGVPPTTQHADDEHVADGIFHEAHAEQVVRMDNKDVPMYNGKPFSASDLRKAAAQGEIELLSHMVDLKPDWINEPDQNGWTALHLATRAGHADVVTFLLQAKCDFMLETNTGRTARRMAVEKWGKDHAVTQILGQYTSTVVPEEDEYTAADVRGVSQTGNIDLLARMLEHKPEWINAQDANGWAPIHLATRGGHTKVVEYLIQAGCNVNLETKIGKTAINIAYDSLGADHAITAMLEEKVGGIPLYEGKAFTPGNVRMAAQVGNLPQLTDLLAIKPDWMNAADTNGWTSLHQAARGGHTHIVEFLVESGCNVHQETITGHTALQIAADRFGDDHPIVELLQKVPRRE